MQRRLHEDGRIRIGQQVPTGNGKSRPAALETFRFTSQNRRAIEAIAKEYGGDCVKWDGAPVGEQWEVFTDAAEIPVVVPPEAMSYSVFYELWSGGGCRRRCDGVADSISDGPCLCDPDNRECSPHTRLSVMLAQYPGTGLWRLDTQGYYAATELGGAMEIVDMVQAATKRSVLPGHLRLERRSVKREGKTHNFVVPVLAFAIDMAALATGNAAALVSGTPALSSPAPALTPVPMDETPAPSLADQMQSTVVRPRRANSGPELPPTGRRPRPASAVEAGVAEARTVIAAGDDSVAKHLTQAFPDAVDVTPETTGEVDTPDPGAVTTKQMNMIRAVLAKDHGITDDGEVHDVVSAHAGRNITSLKQLTKRDASVVIDKLMGKA
jgi:hypothetical protein